MEDFFKTHPVAIAIAAAGALVASWFFESSLIILLACVAGFFVGDHLEKSHASKRTRIR